MRNLCHSMQISSSRCVQVSANATTKKRKKNAEFKWLLTFRQQSSCLMQKKNRSSSFLTSFFLFSRLDENVEVHLFVRHWLRTLVHALVSKLLGTNVDYLQSKCKLSHYDQKLHRLFCSVHAKCTEVQPFELFHCIFFSFPVSFLILADFFGQTTFFFVFAI